MHFKKAWLRYCRDIDKFVYVKTILLSLLLLATAAGLMAQPVTDGSPPAGEVKGSVQDAATHQAVPYAAITLRHLRDTTFFTGTMADSAGRFSIDQLRPGPYRLQTSVVGYMPYTDTILVDPQHPQLQLGILSITSGRTLGEVEISDQRNEFQLEIDKKVFNVEKNSIAAGGSALDALRQVPTVNVDIDGNISLRGSENLLVFINGKPSGLTVQNRTQILQQIPASNIERIELITNPSAKYDADGMSGIINIVTKKSMPAGKFGSLTLGIGTFHKYNASGTLSIRGEKWGVTHTLGFRYNQHFGRGYNTRTNFLPGQPVYSNNQYTNGWRRNVSPTLTGNIDRYFGKKSTLSLNYMFSYGNENSPDSARFDFLDSTDWLYRQYYRYTDENTNNYTIDGGLTFNHKFPKQNRELTALTTVSYINNRKILGYRQQEWLLLGGADSSYLPRLSDNYMYDISLVSITQLDYVHPFGKGFKVETGGKVSIRRFDSEFIADTFDYTQNRYQVDSSLTNHFIYLEDVNAVYGTFSGSVKKFGYQGGLRIEQTNIWGDQLASHISFTKHYVNFFPSVFLSYKFTDVHQLQLSYSRRINRPWSGQLNPFAEYNDPLNLRRGNPDLNPENIDAVELTYNVQLKDHTFLTTGYFRYIDGLIQRYREVDSMGVSTVTFINFDYSMNFGVEFVARNRWFKWWSTTTNFNLFRNQVFGTTQSGELNATNFSYSIRLQSNWKLGKVAEVQMSFNYMGPNTFAQGVMAEMWNLDAALKFDLLKGRMNITLNVTDIFDTRRFAIRSFDDTFEGDVYRKRESRIGTLQFTYKFGSLQNNNTPQRRRGGQDGGEIMDMGM